jgi:hypothetical protein
MAAIIMALVGQYVHIKGKGYTVSGILSRTGDLFQVWSNPQSGTSVGLRFEAKSLESVTVTETALIHIK